jgi:hypothetical protein
VEAKLEAKRYRRDPEGKRDKPIAIIMDLHLLMRERDAIARKIVIAPENRSASQDVAGPE